MLIIREPINSNNYIVTACIGKEYLNSWELYCKKNWLLYCEKNDIGLVIIKTKISDFLPEKEKNIYWQKLLIGKLLKDKYRLSGNICFLDTDILINTGAPNIFKFVSNENFGLVSQKKNLPFDLNYTLKKLAFCRNKFMDSDYPLDSYLFASTKKIFELHNLPAKSDFACTGLFVFNIEFHSEMMFDWYMKYPSQIDTIDGGTEEVHLNFEIQNFGKIDWLDYRFQALWIYEMPNKYSFLYNSLNNHELVRQCIRESINSNFFLHFAGRWEGDMWKDREILNEEFSNNFMDEFNKYLKIDSTGNPVGISKPKL
jgi:hypothetical protein